MIRRKFLQSVGAVGALDVLYKNQEAASSTPVVSAKAEREEWVARCIKVVEPLGDVAGNFEVLFLVLADRDEIAAIDEDIGGLEDRIGEKAVAGG